MKCNNPGKSRAIIELIVTLAGIFATLYGVVMFNQHLLMKFPLGIRMLLMITTQWLLLLIPGILMLTHKEKVKDLGFSDENLFMQILIGIGAALAISAVFTVLPILLGFKDSVGSTNYDRAWKYAFQFVYDIIGIAFAEELIFRGYIFQKLREINDNRWFAVIISSVIFGLFHIFQGNLIQIVLTSFLGLLFCFLREKFKNCTLLTLIIAHGLYDGLIVLWCGIL